MKIKDFCSLKEWKEYIELYKNYEDETTKIILIGSEIEDVKRL